MKCPCCGADTLPDTPWHYDRSTGVLSTDRGAVTLRGWKLRAIIDALTAARMRPLSKGQLIEQVYQLTDEPDWSENGMSVSLHQLRAKIAPLGLEIQSSGTGRGVSGYALVRAG